MLLGTLVLLALLTLVAGRLATRIDQIRAQTSGIDAYASGLVLAQSARAAILFRLATGYAAPSGYVESNGTLLPADGRAIPIDDDVVVTLQDQRGLASINVFDPVVLTKLLVQAGLPAQQAPHLLDTLADYADTDVLNRLNGAEALTYAEQGLLPPRNDWLQSPEELKQIVGWLKHPEVVERLLPWVSSRRDTLFNPNTAPRQVLQAKLPGVSPGQIDALVQRRAIRPANSPAEWRDLVGRAFDNEETLFFVGDMVRITVQVKSQPLAYTYNLLLTPGSPSRPWLVLDSRIAAAAASIGPAERLP